MIGASSGSEDKASVAAMQETQDSIPGLGESLDSEDQYNKSISGLYCFYHSLLCIFSFYFDEGSPCLSYQVVVLINQNLNMEHAGIY